MNTRTSRHALFAGTGTPGKPECLTMPVLEQMGMVQHAITTRKNGLGERINGMKQPDDWAAVAALFGISPDRLVTLNQVHGEQIVAVDGQNYAGMRSVLGDALVTRERGIAIGIETADCVPVLLFDPSVPAIGAVHAGWRSTVKKIVQKTAAAMKKEFGSDPARMVAAIGPAIGPECYEVDEPVMGPVRKAFPYWTEITVPRTAGRWGLDLVKANKRELMLSGLAEENIQAMDLCTSCRRDLFYSFRADGRTGRMLSVIMLKP
jgi:polyphenol oxidase